MFFLRLQEEGKKDFLIPLPLVTDMYHKIYIENENSDEVVTFSVENTVQDIWVLLQRCELSGDCEGKMIQVDAGTGKEREIYSTFVTENIASNKERVPLLYISFENQSDIIAQCQSFDLNHFPVNDLVLADCDTLHYAKKYSSINDDGPVRRYYREDNEQILPVLIAENIVGDLSLRFVNLLNKREDLLMHSIPKSQLGKSSIVILDRE